MPDTATTLTAAWKSLRIEIDRRLSDYVDALPECPETLTRSMRYSIEAGGKRLRPVLTLLACEACGGDSEAAFPAACAVELVHTYSLIHDDLPAMDDDALRRGKPTNHVVFGEATAILAGDALLTLAFEILARDVAPPDVAAACCVDLASASGRCGMVGGQMADLEAESGGVQSVRHLESIHARKTGRLITCALTMGARVAHASPQLLEAVIGYGRCIGLAFQIVDDVLDCTGSEAKLGKGVRKDSGHGKLTYPSLLGVEESRRWAARLIDESCEYLVPLGERGRRLEALARFILERDH